MSRLLFDLAERLTTGPENRQVGWTVTPAEATTDRPRREAA